MIASLIAVVLSILSFFMRFARAKTAAADKLMALQDGALFVLRTLDQMEANAPVWQKEPIDKAREEMKKKLWPGRG